MASLQDLPLPAYPMTIHLGFDILFHSDLPVHDVIYRLDAAGSHLPWPLNNNLQLHSSASIIAVGLTWAIL